MGEIIDNIKNAAAGKPYGGPDNNVQNSNTQTPIMGKPQILKHSLDSIEPLINNPMKLNENAIKD